jgi:hypothetical protein
MIGFEQAQYTVAEGEMTEVTVSVISGFLLERDIMATVTAYTVEEGEIVVVMVELCGNITDDVVVNVMTD